MEVGWDPSLALVTGVDCGSVQCFKAQNVAALHLETLAIGLRTLTL